MNKVQQLIRVIESSTLYSVGDLTISKINDAFIERLIGHFDHPEISVDSIIDFEGDGIFVRFEDNEGDSVIIQFHINDEGPRATVVSDDDQQIEIDLGPLNPIITSFGGNFDSRFEYIDLSNIGWMNKSVIDILLRAGQVVEDQTMVAVGGRAVKLPIVRIRDKMTDDDLRILKKVKKMNFDTSSSNEFANRIKDAKTYTN